MYDPAYPALPFAAFFGFFLGLVPLSWHLHAWNAGTCAFMFWASISCFIEFVNAIVWRDTMLNLAPIWCDITSKFLLGAGIGIPASSLCIVRRLYHIATIQTAPINNRDKKRSMAIDLCIAVGIPVFVMLFHFIVQSHRFDVLETVGCYPALYNTLLSIFFVLLWAPLLGCVSLVYSCLALRAFWNRRVLLNDILSSAESLSISRYLRLILLVCIQMFYTIPAGIYSIYASVHGTPLTPWVSWRDTHYSFSRVRLVTAAYWRGSPTYRTSVELTRWLFPVSALLFFVLFGLGGRARRRYSQACLALVQTFDRLKQRSKDTLPRWKDYSSSDPPSTYADHRIRRTDSLSSLADAKTSDANRDLEKSIGTETSTISTLFFNSPDSDTASISSSVIAAPPSPIPGNILDPHRVVPQHYIAIQSMRSTDRERVRVLAVPAPVVPAFHRPFSSM